MSRIDINGYDPVRAGYEVTLTSGKGTALIPDSVIAAEYGGVAATPSQAEEWIAAMAHDIADAIETLTAGGTVKPPLTGLRLVGSGQ